MVRHDALDRRRVGRRVPLVELERSAEDDPVGTREHVAGPAGEGVAHLGLRLEDRKLAARGPKVLVAEQLPAAEAGAVEDEAFRECVISAGVANLRTSILPPAISTSLVIWRR